MSGDPNAQADMLKRPEGVVHVGVARQKHSLYGYSSGVAKTLAGGTNLQKRVRKLTIVKLALGLYLKNFDVYL